MDIRGPIARLDRDGWLQVAGGAAAAVVAIALYTRFSLDGALSRDESIYAYGGQQLAHGVAPYVSVFDPKTPFATMLCGLGVGLANLFGVYDLHMIRLVFFACSVLTVVAIYLLVTRVWNSVAGGLVAAVVFASYDGFARDALAGPDAKTPGVLCLVVCMWLALRRNWFWAGFTAALAFLAWQPFLIFPAVAVLYAGLAAPGHRRRALAVAGAGVAVPLVVTLGYFAAAGAIGDFFESTFAYPLTGVQRNQETVGGRLQHIVDVVHDYYAFSGVLFWIGAGLLLVIAAVVLLRGQADWRATLTDPVLVVIVLTGLFEFGYACTDFQSYPDVFPLLPYPAIGIGGAVALGLRQLRTGPAHRIAIGVTAFSLVILVVLSAFWFTDSAANDTALRHQQAMGCALERTVLPDTPLYALGDPVPLVVTDRRNPDRFIYLESGVDQWKIDHTTGGFTGWTQQIAAAAPSVVVIAGWKGPHRAAMGLWLRAQGYLRGFIGSYRVRVTPAARSYGVANGVQLTSKPTDWPMTTLGDRFTDRSCVIG